MSIGNSQSQDGSDVFLKYLSQYYQNGSDPVGLDCRKLKLSDSIVEAYNNKFDTKLKAFQLLEQLKQNEKSFQPYDWQKLFLDVFNDESEEVPAHHTCEDAPEMTQTTENEESNKNMESNIPIAAQEIDYKTMSIYELKRALLVSKLEMLDAQEALKKAKETIRLNEEECLKQIIDE